MTSDPALALLRPFRPRCASLLFLHRFASPDRGVEGHDPDVLRAHLEYLRRHRYQLIALGDLLTRVEKGAPFTENVVIFTVDDGYADFSEVAAPIFAQYDCPVTVFLITDFIAGKLWNWWDRVAWILEHTDRKQLAIEIGGIRTLFDWISADQRAIVTEKIVEALKRVPDSEKEAAIRRIAELLEVSLPDGIPPRDRAMTWEDVRRCGRDGIAFGPHTVSHPILSRVDSERSNREIEESWRAVAAQTEAAVPIFCYPNGTPADFSNREKESVARAGLEGALSTVEASIASPPLRRETFDRFAIPRYAYQETGPAFIQIVSGLDALKGGQVGG